MTTIAHNRYNKFLVFFIISENFLESIWKLEKFIILSHFHLQKLWLNVIDILNLEARELILIKRPSVWIYSSIWSQMFISF